MVVNLSISQWTARKYDAKVSKEVEASHQAHDSGRFNKILIATEALKAIQKIAGSARTFHYFNTLPWGDNGDRILPSANYFNYITEMGKFKSQFEGLVEEFITQYPALIEDARTRLNTMFNNNDYPHPGFIRDRFGIKFAFMPVPDTDDLRVNISDEEVNRIKSEIQGEITNRIDNTVKDMLNRIKEAVGHMAGVLSNEVADVNAVDPTGKAGIVYNFKNQVFRDSLVGNICNLIEVIPALNFNNDPHVNEMVNMIKPLCVNPDDLRKNDEFRREIAKKAKNVLSYI